MPKKILTVDDDPTIIELLRVNLEMEGYEVLVAGDGEQALAVAGDSAPDLIILDVMMPRMDGFTARKELLNNPATAKIPVIFLSARAQQGDIDEGHRAGVAEYMTKPFDPAELMAVIDQVLRGTYRSKASKG